MLLLLTNEWNLILLDEKQFDKKATQMTKNTNRAQIVQSLIYNKIILKIKYITSFETKKATFL